MAKPHIKRHRSIRAALERWSDSWSCAGATEYGWVEAHSITPAHAYTHWLRKREARKRKSGG